MKHVVLTVLMAVVLSVAASGTAFADWQLYWKGDNITATFDLLSREPFHGKPSLWVKWNYAKPMNGIAGIKLQFMADCSGHRLYKIYEIPYDAGGNFLKPKKYYASPREYKIIPASPGEATYKLMCH